MLVASTAIRPCSTYTMDATKQDFNLRDLGTKSVTLFPSRAQIVRELKDVHLAVSPRAPPFPSLA